jgi:hypothetical protein
MLYVAYMFFMNFGPRDKSEEACPPNRQPWPARLIEWVQPRVVNLASVGGYKLAYFKSPDIWLRTFLEVSSTWEPQTKRKYVGLIHKMYQFMWDGRGELPGITPHALADCLKEYLQSLYVFLVSISSSLAHKYLEIFLIANPYDES